MTRTLLDERMGGLDVSILALECAGCAQIAYRVVVIRHTPFSLRSATGDPAAWALQWAEDACAELSRRTRCHEK